MRAVNLIPPEDRRGDHAPLRAGVASYAIVGVLAIALIGLVMVILAGNKIKDSEAQLAALETQQAQADAAAAELAPYGTFAALEQSRSDTVASLAQSRFDWERVLNELALVVPRRVTLENLTGSAAAGAAAGGDTTATGTTDASITGPSLQIGGCAQGQKGVARFLAALKDIDGVTRVGMQSSELGEEIDPAVGATPTEGAPVGDSATGETSSDCQTGPEVAKFQATVAFDEVPPPVAAAPATPATAPATTTDAATTATTEGGVAEAEAEKQTAVDSAGEQVSEAKSGAAAAGVSGE